MECLVFAGKEREIRRKALKIRDFDDKVEKRYLSINKKSIRSEARCGDLRGFGDRKRGE